MKRHPVRIAGILVGDIHKEPGARTKYGLLFQELARRYRLVGVHDATLRGVNRWLNALRLFHPNRRVWRERFYQNVPAFRTRSRRAAAYLQSMRGVADVALQVGALFDARWGDVPLPSVIYTDYTAALAAEKTTAGRSPFTPRQRRQWITLEKQAFQRAARICARGQFVRDAIVERYGIAPEKVTAVGGGVNFDPLPDVETKTTTAAPTALFIGKDFYRKGGDLLLRAFAQARARIPDARLLLVTTDPIPAHLPLDGVELIPPTWDRAAIAALYRRADLFVLPSRLETWGDVLLEAMAYGLPCLGVSGEAMGEIIEDGVTGLVAPPEDAAALADGLTQLLEDATLRRRWGLAGRARLEANYTWEKVVDRLAPAIEAAPFL